METNITAPELLTNDQLHALGIVEDKKRKSSSSAALSYRGKLRKFYVATGDYC